ncbi:MAG: outer membrane protein assembly factor BamD [Gammaproteobacteria bacterium]|nr:outer membrane protein assembly factor BamD [Gammaproteobacteria bacterium]NIR97794.1 outer membrane protein assembly factor BamD [Gammaproteobacteria bacterium]NIT63494.1 outer membrane protein assembly factor BamD [Gammaproteobacteria bacterium]NIV20441.1 outer membrane protein assembly factor BamD [Gammaproteobacteria bacterium]NIX11023.1 outer membrane protein assembly factor BamD [Gammaproteobacteria bacterium]
MRIVKALLILCLGAGAGACSWLPEQVDETKDWSASRMYSEAKSALGDHDYEQAIRYYELLEARYPFGRYAQQAQLEVAYAYYRYDEPESAIAAADRFIKLHPRHPHVDYAYYLKGLVNYNRNAGLLARIFPQDPSTRDPGAARRAFLDFSELVKKFPQSEYARDASQRMLFLRNTLAKHQINVARYYMKRGAYVAAANRAKDVVERYEGSASVPEALQIMAQAYARMDMPKLADDAQRVMTMNFPDYAGPEEDSWWLF